MKIDISNDPDSQFKKLLQLQNKKTACGISTSTYQLHPNYGQGLVESFYFEGLLISVFNLKFKNDIQFTGNYNLNALELSVLLQGEKIVNISHHEYKDIVLEKNECYLLHAQNLNGKLTCYKDKPIKELKIKMYDEFINKHQLQSILDFHNFKNKGENISKQLTHKMEEIVLEILSNKQNGLLKRLFLESKTLELLHLHLSSNHTRPIQGENLIKKIYRVESMIQSNIDKHITVQQLARSVLLNEKILKSEFKKVFGLSIFNYSQKIRMQKAQNLLSNTQKPIYEIADLVGYKNPTHFTAAFKKVFLITPKNYRKQSLYPNQ